MQGIVRESREGMGSCRWWCWWWLDVARHAGGTRPGQSVDWVPPVLSFLCFIPLSPFAPSTLVPTPCTLLRASFLWCHRATPRLHRATNPPSTARPCPLSGCILATQLGWYTRLPTAPIPRSSKSTGSLQCCSACPCPEGPLRVRRRALADSDTLPRCSALLPHLTWGRHWNQLEPAAPLPRATPRLPGAHWSRPCRQPPRWAAWRPAWPRPCRASGWPCPHRPPSGGRQAGRWVGGRREGARPCPRRQGFGCVCGGACARVQASSQLAPTQAPGRAGHTRGGLRCGGPCRRRPRGATASPEARRGSPTTAHWHHPAALPMVRAMSLYNIMIGAWGPPVHGSHTDTAQVPPRHAAEADGAVPKPTSQEQSGQLPPNHTSPEPPQQVVATTLPVIIIRGAGSSGGGAPPRTDQDVKQQ